MLYLSLIVNKQKLKFLFINTKYIRQDLHSLEVGYIFNDEAVSPASGKAQELAEGGTI